MGAFEMGPGLNRVTELRPAFGIAIHLFPTSDTWFFDTGYFKCWSKATSRVRDGAKAMGG